MSYTYSQPAKKPDWAMLDGTNGVAGGVNTIEPPTGKKNYGFDFGEKPKSSDWNWIGRITANWIYYLDERITSLLLISSNTQDAHTFFRNQS